MNENKTTYKDSPLGKIPSDWEINSFASVCEKLLDGTHFSPQSKDGPYKYLTSKNIRNDGLDLDSINHVSEEDHKEIYKRCPVKFDDVLLTKDGAGTGACCKNTLNEEFSLLSSVAVLRVNGEKMNNEYLIHFIKSHIGQKIIQDEISGQAITRITLEKIRSFRIIIPPLPEQKAIAYILGLMDTAINKNNSLIAKKELQKKWLMQNLLTRKKKLLNDELGIINDKWKTIKLGDVFEFIKSYSISRDGLTKSTKENLIYCIHYGDIHAFYETDFLDFSNQQGIPQIIDEARIIYEKDYLKEGDVIMADASEDYKGVGEAIVVLNLEKRTAVGGLHTIVLRDYSGETEALFRGYLFASESMRNKLRTKATGTSVYSVTKSQLESLTLLLPPVKEQNEIAQVLRAADKEIQLLKAKTERLRDQKKGLMQVLLTGKKRLQYE